MSLHTRLRSRRASTARARAADAALPVVALDRSGAVVRADGTIVRVLRLTPFNPRLLSAAEGERLATGFAALADALPPGASLQFYLDAGGAPGQRSAPGAYVAVPSAVRGATPARGRLSRALVGRLARARREALQISLLDAEAVRARLGGLGLPARLLDGPDVASLLMRRLEHSPPPRHEGRQVEVLGELDEREEAEAADSAARDLRQHVALLAPRFAPRHVEIGRDLEQVVHLGSGPQAQAFAWLADALGAQIPCALAVHVHAPAVPREHRRRREDAAPSSATVSIYQSVREPGPDASIVRLVDEADAAAEALAVAAGARVHRGEFRQGELWISTLPIADDAAGVAHPCTPEELGRAIPLIATSCGSPVGVALGAAEGGDLLERIDPFDPLHATSALLISGEEAARAGRALVAQLGAAGLRSGIVGHPPLPGAPLLGSVAHINPWDFNGPTDAREARIRFLVDLHELLLGRDAGPPTPTRDGLAAAIRAAYADADRDGRAPRERDLARVLEDVEDLRALRDALAALLGRRDAAALLDSPTDLEQDTGAVAVDCGALPPPLARAATLIAADHLAARLTRPRPGGTRAGAALLVEDAGRLATHPAGAAWLARAARGARRRGLLLIAAADRLADFAAPPGRAALPAFSLRLALRDDGGELAGARAALRLGEAEVELIGELARAESGRARAHWINGVRGRGIVELSLRAAGCEPAVAI